MSIYCVADIHGCFDEFKALLRHIKFSSDEDIIYVLGDVIDRGPKPIACLQYIMQAKGIHMILGNHEQMMLDYFDYRDSNWSRNGYLPTMNEFSVLSNFEQDRIITYLRNRPLYKTLKVNGRRFFLSHAGLNPKEHFKYQFVYDLLWGRKMFYENVALPNHICVFGHTPTIRLNGNNNCSVWFDTDYNDKVNIDCGCVHGGALSALKLDDGEVFYVKPRYGIPIKYNFAPRSAPAGFLDADRQSLHKQHVADAEFRENFARSSKT